MVSLVKSYNVPTLSYSDHLYCVKLGIRPLNAKAFELGIGVRRII